MQGVDDAYQSTAVQSVRSFSPPLTLEAKVMGTIANSSPFALYLVKADGGQYLTLNGNLDTGNGGYYGSWLGNTDPSNNAGNAARRVLSRADRKIRGEPNRRAVESLARTGKLLTASGIRRRRRRKPR